MRDAAMAALAMLALFATAPAPADDPRPADKDKLVGTWRLISSSYNGRDFSFPEGVTVVKHVTPTHFATFIYDEDGKISRAARGRYELDGDTYKETPEYGTSQNFGEIRSKVQSFRCRLDGDIWHHEGELSSGLRLHETYQRAKKP